MLFSCCKAAAVASPSHRVTGLRQAVSSHRALASLSATYPTPTPPVLKSSFSTTSGGYTSHNSSRAKKKTKIEKHGPDLKEFMLKVGGSPVDKIYPEPHQFVDPASLRGDGLKVFLDVYGCQMNVADAEVVLGILGEQGYSRTLYKEDADIWLLLTCSIREGAEDKIWRKLHHIETARKHRRLKNGLVVGVLGCMAERVKAGLLSQGATSVVAGPDSYRDLPRLLASQRLTGQAAINVLLSLQETYSGVTPVRLNNSVSAFVSIQRGCDNMCSYCIVPHTRGRERSRPINSILEEVRLLRESGVREITLLGQNVNSYRDTSSRQSSCGDDFAASETAPGFSTVYKPKKGGLRFVHLLDKVSEANPDVRIRFTAPHPKDFPVELLDLIGERSNICKQLHLPAQSGSTRVLSAMNRGYTREAYLSLVDAVKSRLPGIALTSDFIVGFCGETEEDFQETVDLVKQVDYHKAFMYPYSMREKTAAHRKLEDTVPEEVKAERHLRLKEVYRESVRAIHRLMHGSSFSVLVTGDSKRSSEDLQGLTDNGVKVIFSKEHSLSCPKAGDLVTVEITGSSSEVVHERNCPIVPECQDDDEEGIPRRLLVCPQDVLFIMTNHANARYSGDARALDKELGDWLRPIPLQNSPARAVICPHAGYRYSGPTAAHSFRQIDPRVVKTIFVLGPSHHVRLSGCAVTQHVAYQTPLYDLSINTEISRELLDTGHFEVMTVEADEDEHSIEMQLPYIAKVMESARGKFNIVPVMVGSLSTNSEAKYGKIFAKYLEDPSNCFVISSDFCHWGQRFRYTQYDQEAGDIYQWIEALDKQGMDLIERLDAPGFASYLKRFGNTICGRHPIGVFLNMVAEMKASRSNGYGMDLKFLNYAQSNQVKNPRDSSVSYAAATFVMH